MITETEHDIGHETENHDIVNNIVEFSYESHSKDCNSDCHYDNCHKGADEINDWKGIFEWLRNSFVIDQNHHALEEDEKNLKYLHALDCVLVALLEWLLLFLIFLVLVISLVEWILSFFLKNFLLFNVSFTQTDENKIGQNEK